MRRLLPRRGVAWGALAPPPQRLAFRALSTTAASGASTTPSSSSHISIDFDPKVSNVTKNIAGLLNRRLLHTPDHPLEIIKRRISEDVFGASFKLHDDIAPIVTTTACFDVLRIPKDHQSRSKSDTYYVDEARVLRPHTSAHQVELLRRGEEQFLVAGDVYRRDEIDATHFPGFHQLEGVRLMPKGATEAEAFADLKETLGRLCDVLFGISTRENRTWIEAYFPFTDPSAELEIVYKEKLIEVLGCGVVHRDVLRAAGLPDDRVAWAFGIGLERMAMILFGISDIRLFWSKDARFMKPFKGGLEKMRRNQPVQFKPFSVYPAISREISFWIDESKFHENDVFSIVREVAGDEVEVVERKDEFEHPVTKRKSKAYRMVFRNMHRTLLKTEADAYMDLINRRLVEELNVEVR